MRGLKTLVDVAAGCLLAALYAALMALVNKQLQPSLIAFPLLAVLLSLGFSKWKLLRFAGFLAVLPVAVIGFEVFRSTRQPNINAYEIKSLDRSHYVPDARVPVPGFVHSVEGGHGWGVKEIYIGADGFRADPETGKGNPPSCRYALVGDSMIYGSGLPYADTLRPALERLGTNACVFGVSGNASVDYVHTLAYVQERLEPGAHVAVYLYAYNDFVSSSKYARRRFGSLALSLGRLADVIEYLDAWRQGTFTYGVFQRPHAAAEPKNPAWDVDLGGGATMRSTSSVDPAQYRPPGPLDEGQRKTLAWFFEGLKEIATGRDWKVSIVLIPDNEEFLASLARHSPALLDLDERRRDAMRICRESWYGCEDLGPFLYSRTVAEKQNPFFVDDRHFSAFGTRLVASHYLDAAARAR